MEQDRTAVAAAQSFTSDAAGLADASFKIRDLHIDERERISYTRDRILQIREDIEISEDILKVKQLIEAEFDGTKSEDLHFQGRERICYSIDQLLRLQKVAKIPEDILKIKKEFDVETKASASPSFSDLSGSPPEIDNLVQQRAQMEDCTWSRGQSECTYFMKFGTCKFGSTCKYKHTQSSATTGSSLADGPVQRPTHMDYTERCHQSDCPYFMEFGTCKFGPSCKYQHRRLLASNYCTSQMDGPIPRQSQMEEYSLSPGEPVCLYFIKHGTCNFHHPSSSTLSYLTTKADGLIHHEGQLDEYPQRPGEPECSYFIKHGTCKFRYTCKFHHPSPSTLSYLTTKADGLIHHEGQLDEYPQRPGEPECSYFIKHGTCKFKSACKFHHPSPSTLSYLTTEADGPIHHEGQLDEYPQRPGEPECSYFMKHGTCKFRYTCKFHHPAPSTLGGLTVKVDDPVHWEQMEEYCQRRGLTVEVDDPVHWEQKEEYPQRPGEPECSYFIKYGTCKFRYSCKFHHPAPSTLGCLTVKVDDPVHREQMEQHPQRPECSYFIKYGTCKFESACKFHHPSPTTFGGLTTEANDWVHHQGHMGHSEIPGEADCLPTVPLCIISPAGLPLRPGRPTCSYYSRFGTCKFGPQCRFDHPY